MFSFNLPFSLLIIRLVHKCLQQATTYSDMKFMLVDGLLHSKQQKWACKIVDLFPSPPRYTNEHNQRIGFR